MLKEGTFIRRKYHKMLLCSVLGWIVSILGGIADSIVAGLFLGSEAVSAVGLVSPLQSIIYCLAMLVGAGFPLLYSVSLGAFEVEKSRKIAGMGILVALGLGIIMMFIMIAAKEAVLAFYGCTGKIYEYAAQYYGPNICLAFIEPVLWTVYNLVSYDGDEKLILINDIAMAFSNVAFSAILCQSYGTAGLSLGTALSYVLGLVLLIPHFFKKTNSIHFKFDFKWRFMLESIKLSSSSSLTTFYVAIVDIVFNKFIICRFGENMLPAYTVVNTVMNFASFLLCSMDAGAVFVTVAYGEENNFSVRRTMKLVLRSMLYISIVFSALMMFIASYWPVIYKIKESAVAEASVFAGKIIPAAYIFAAVVYNYLKFYQSTRKPFEGNFLSVFYMLIGPLVLAYPMGLFGSFNSMSVGFAFTPVFSITALLICCLIRKNVGKLPYLLSNDNEINFHCDLQLNDENIVELRDRIGDFLKSCNVNGKTVNQIEIIVEETLVHIKNKNKKQVCCECDVLLNDDHVRLITKDNGIIFDMTKEADDSLDLGCYLAARMMEKTKEKNYTTTTSFNRNTYIWER